MPSERIQRRIESALDEVMDAFGAIHIGVNVAGGGTAKRTVSRSGPHPLDEFRRIIELNLIATFNLVRLQADRMTRNEPEDGEEPLGFDPRGEAMEVFDDVDLIYEGVFPAS